MPSLSPYPYFEFAAQSPVVVVIGDTLWLPAPTVEDATSWIEHGEERCCGLAPVQRMSEMRAEYWRHEAGALRAEILDRLWSGPGCPDSDRPLGERLATLRTLEFIVKVLIPAMARHDSRAARRPHPDLGFLLEQVKSLRDWAPLRKLDVESRFAAIGATLEPPADAPEICRGYLNGHLFRGSHLRLRPSSARRMSWPASHDEWRLSGAIGSYRLQLMRRRAKVDDAVAKFDAKVEALTNECVAQTRQQGGSHDAEQFATIGRCEQVLEALPRAHDGHGERELYDSPTWRVLFKPECGFLAGKRVNPYIIEDEHHLLYRLDATTVTVPIYSRARQVAGWRATVLHSNYDSPFVGSSGNICLGDYDSHIAPRLVGWPREVQIMEFLHDASNTLTCGYHSANGLTVYHRPDAFVSRRIRASTAVALGLPINRYRRLA